VVILATDPLLSLDLILAIVIAVVVMYYMAHYIVKKFPKQTWLLR
jgi:hypothetical protein